MKKVEVAVPDLAKQSDFVQKIAEERQRQEQLMQMLSFDGDDPDEKFDHLMKQIGQLQDTIYGIESFLEAVTPRTCGGIWVSLITQMQQLIRSRRNGISSLDELHAEPDQGREI